MYSTVFPVAFNAMFFLVHKLFFFGLKIFSLNNLNASQRYNQSKGLGGNIGYRDKSSTWYSKGFPNVVA